MYYICYSCAGNITIAEKVTLSVQFDLNGDSPQFKLTCTSNGGPATTVIWTRDSKTVSGGKTVLNDTVTAQYTHTLTVTGRLGGQYQCIVANSKPSEATATFNVEGIATIIHEWNTHNLFPPLPVASAPTGLTAVQEGPTGIRVSWTPPTPLGDTTGYRIYYSGGSSDSVDVSGGSTHTHLLTGLQNVASYNISIVAISPHFYSDLVTHTNNVSLGESFNLCHY